MKTSPSATSGDDTTSGAVTAFQVQSIATVEAADFVTVEHLTLQNTYYAGVELREMSCAANEARLRQGEEDIGRRERRKGEAEG
mgnify:CR=1 FL=1